MSKSCSIAEAKNQLPRLVHIVEDGESITLTRRGKPVAALVRFEELERLQRLRTRFSASYDELRRRFDFEELDIDPEQVFQRSQDPSGGREHAW